jgi:hypothetical protein
MNLDLYNKEHEQRLDEIMEKLDNRHMSSDKDASGMITYKELLKFFDNEGLRREMVNDAQLYGVSVKRLEEYSRKNLKEDKN